MLTQSDAQEKICKSVATVMDVEDAVHYLVDFFNSLQLPGNAATWIQVEDRCMYHAAEEFGYTTIV